MTRIRVNMYSSKYLSPFRGGCVEAQNRYFTYQREKSKEKTGNWRLE
jgi:hypothetical protein